MSILSVLPLAVEKGAGAAPYEVGGLALVILLGLLLSLLAFGKGREHS
ncbi:MAG: hypothetical protein JWR35_3326 [Marmoricola sp.]|jgi:hypothetical protein|nr:hypothetical protein [Marmoricola sp.]